MENGSMTPTFHKDQQLHLLNKDMVSIAKYRNEVSSQGIDIEEVEANRFAAELLMPEEMITGYMKKKDLSFISEEIIEDMAMDFQVSVAALSIRLSKLQLLY